MSDLDGKCTKFPSINCSGLSDLSVTKHPLLLQGMEELIKQSFLHVEVVRPHVHEGYYDLFGPDGERILPTVWERVIQPDWSITMHMWPMDRIPTPQGLPILPKDRHAARVSTTKNQGSPLRADKSLSASSTAANPLHDDDREPRQRERDKRQDSNPQKRNRRIADKGWMPLWK